VYCHIAEQDGITLPCCRRVIADISFGEFFFSLHVVYQYIEEILEN
jgi:hypothetical protein